MKHLGISGGGTKVSGLFGAAEVIMTDKAYKPDIISGISAGAILAVPLAMATHDAAYYDRIREVVLNLEMKQFFNKSPIKPDGSIRGFNAFWKLLTGKRSLGEQENLKKTISQVIDPQTFATYVNNDDIPVCIVGTVDFYTGKRFFFNLKEVTYNFFLEFVNASASIPIFTPGFYFEGTLVDFEGKQSRYGKHLLFDGGVRDHSPTNKVIGSEVYNGKIKQSATIFSRPEKLEQILNPKDFDKKIDLVRVLSRYVDITNAEVSKSDKDKEAEIIAKRKIIDRGTVYLPKVMDHVYDITPQKLKQLYDAGRNAVDQYWLQA